MDYPKTVKKSFVSIERDLFKVSEFTKIKLKKQKTTCSNSLLLLLPPQLSPLSNIRDRPAHPTDAHPTVPPLVHLTVDTVVKRDLTLPRDSLTVDTVVRRDPTLPRDSPTVDTVARRDPTVPPRDSPTDTVVRKDPMLPRDSPTVDTVARRDPTVSTVLPRDPTLPRDSHTVTRPLASRPLATAPP